MIFSNPRRICAYLILANYETENKSVNIVRMKTKISLALIVIIAALLGILGYTKSKKSIPESQEVHLHAGFQVYKDDKLVDFSDMKYMKIEPCSEEEHEETNPEEEQLEKAHLHDGVGDVVHVHRAQATWGNLFVNISYKLDLQAQGYINGRQIPDFINQEIHEYDSLVVFEGQNTSIEEKLQNTVTKQYIQEVENERESC